MSHSSLGLYQKSPLMDVTCQLNFPDILKISSEPPAAFQDKMRKDYPLFQVTQDRRGYTLVSTDRAWQIVLTQGSLALISRAYSGWKDYRDKIATASAALEDCYQPSFLSRVGLRYRSFIRPSQFGIGNQDWASLINTQILGPFSVPEVQGDLQGSQHQVVMALSGGHDRFRLSHGFVVVTDSAQIATTGERSYQIDQDYFTMQQLGRPEALEKLDAFEREAGRFFRLCISETLHQTMVPKAA